MLRQRGQCRDSPRVRIYVQRLDFVFQCEAFDNDWMPVARTLMVPDRQCVITTHKTKVHSGVAPEQAFCVRD